MRLRFVVLLAEGHRAEANLGHLQIAVAQVSPLHSSPPACRPTTIAECLGAPGREAKSSTSPAIGVPDDGCRRL
jgi:hypothetical protein